MPEKLLPPAPSVHTSPEHIKGYAPLGMRAVQSEEERLAALMQADYHEQAAAFTGRYEGVPDPRYVGRMHTLGRRLLGKQVAGPEVADWLHKNQEMNLAATPSYHQGFAEDYSGAAEGYGNERDGAIIQARNRIQGSDGEGNRILHDYITTFAPVILRDNYRAWAKDKKGAKPSEWLASLPSEQLMNFLQWHTNRVEAINNNPETKERISREKNAYKAKVTEAVEQGKLPGTALTAIARIEQAPVFIGDTFDTSMEDKNGFILRNTGDVVLTQYFTPKTFRHEMNHKFLGTFRSRILNEAMTEYLSIALGSGDFSRVDSEITDGEKTYGEERMLLATLLTEGKNPNLFTEAIAAYTEKDLQGPARQHFKHALAQSFGVADVDMFIEMQDIEGHTRIAGLNPKLSEQDKEVYAVQYANEGLRILGALQKGMSPEEILNWEYDFSESQSASDGIAPEFQDHFKEKSLARIKDHIRQVVTLKEELSPY